MARRPRQIGSIIGWPGDAVESAVSMVGIGAEMPGQIERELHARRILRVTLVDADLEVIARDRDGAPRRPLRPASRRRAA